MKRGIVVLWVLCAASSGAGASAADAVVEKLQGKVYVRARGEKNYSAARAGRPLSFGDGVKTGPKALAHVVFADGAAVLIKEGSIFTLEGAPKAATLRFTIGEFLIGLKRRLGKGESLRVSTPAAVAAVRGTLFWGKSDEKKNSVFAAIQHSISVTAGGKTLVLAPGQKSTIAFGRAPSAPEPSGVAPEFIDTFAVDGSVEGVKELLRGD